ncbi:MAG: glucose-6-phosphate dehydrogenase [Alphaproteobacteria bacterium CG_4_10_14_0_2_um_filter_63_37]|nr:MAG: glucose-6-phosphate dehydrogenase [Proteobacteria bacterium CG1_02_64_396]PJA25898.1 MAG: glucose-6-phosphate dehydrogenase [Alphaproteobacteria bacterium CG_4_10_14_0_2_um_filter_63_37]
MGRRHTPASIVIFGASGDLTHRKLIPSLYQLAVDGLLAPNTAIVGYARRNWSREEFLAGLRQSVRKTKGAWFDHEVWNDLAERISYISGDLTETDGFCRLHDHLAQIEKNLKLSGNRLYYLSTPPRHYADIVANLAGSGLAAEGVDSGWRRIVVEKPFGTDLASAMELNAQIHEVFREDQIFRIDHYLGKETVQNILAFRLGNGIFEPLWNHHYVDHVQITVAETLGVEGRGGYFDQAGIIRDMVQNHALQLLTLVAMEPPAAFEANAVRDEKVKVLRAIRPLTGEAALADTARGQYDRGAVEGTKSSAYREEPGVDPASTTETYMAMKLHIDNWRWARVPFYIRCGKRLPHRTTQIVIAFKQPPHTVLQSAACDCPNLEPNRIVLRIQPNEGISLHFGIKAPGSAMQIEPVEMDFDAARALGSSPEAYERLILDAIGGDATLFARSDEIEWAWRFIDGIVAAWQGQGLIELPVYTAGTWGTAEGKDLMQRDGRTWLDT